MPVSSQPAKYKLDMLNQTFRQIRNSLKLAESWGCREFACSPEHIDKVNSWGQPTARTFAGDSLERIRQDLGDCTRCPLCRDRKRLVFGEGAADARLVFVGEGPGFEEDQQGRPFVGPAGQLLTRIIGAMHLTREQVYICNVVKCRPPKNRTPEPVEIKTCRPFLERQLAAIQPLVICTLGAVATSTLMGRNISITRLRGRFHDYNGISLMPTFHPSYLLRTPERKREVWEDMKMIMALLDIPL
jgi:DNA polymerase